MGAPGSPLVAVSPVSAFAGRSRLLAALEAAFDVRFGSAGPGPGAAEPPDALLVLTDGVPRACDLERSHGLPMFAVPASSRRPARAEDVVLRAEPAVDRRMRSVVLPGHAATGPLADLEHETVLAETASGAAWTCLREQPASQRVTAALPELSPHEVLRDLLISPHVLALVALTHFLRGLAGPDARAQPRVRATMLFDDPNLRRPTYGFIDFARLVEHGDEHGYHAAMAMIPLDSSLPHGATAALFRRRADRLSLVVHGNNHIKRELSAPQTSADAISLAAQALRRVSRFEKRHRVKVDRVMTPPHGLCSSNMTRALGIVGFDALCALHPLPWREGSPPQRLLAGWDAAEFAGPCAVIPRMPLFASSADIALHAFLGHPVVLYGHHEDLADGLEPLQRAAERVNAVGDIEWASMGEIAFGNYVLRMEGRRAVVRAYSRRVRVELPAGAGTLTLLAPRDAASHFVGWSVDDVHIAAFGDSLACGGGRTVTIRLHPIGEIDPAVVDAPPFRPWPVLRRAATELRDRTLPLRTRNASVRCGERAVGDGGRR
ncbi:MAG TPA: hypothetical protein VGO80_00955 [Solirubrobacteraceae bacterium]|nr:hypothetical protein [Solirubrobacteraceae bacterium]